MPEPISRTTARLQGHLPDEPATGVEQPFPFGLTDDGLTRHPHVARLAENLASSDYEVKFERGLQLLLDAVTLRLIP